MWDDILEVVLELLMDFSNDAAASKHPVLRFLGKLFLWLCCFACLATAFYGFFTVENYWLGGIFLALAAGIVYMLFRAKKKQEEQEEQE